MAELTELFNRIGLKPVVCGGLGIYLCFHKGDAQDRDMVRATSDIDLMLTRSQVLEQAKRRAIAEIITGELKYIVREGREHLHFKKDDDHYLDILAPRIEGFETHDFRIKSVRSKLHAHITDEARFIEEGLRTIPLRRFLPDDKRRPHLMVQVPSPTNALILKLFAFNDRDKKQEYDWAQAHAWDIFIAIMLSGRADYLEAQGFLSEHSDSDIVSKARSIVDAAFYSSDKPGWQRVLEASAFYPQANVGYRRGRLDEAGRRLVRWFTT